MTPLIFCWRKILRAGIRTCVVRIVLLGLLKRSPRDTQRAYQAFTLCRKQETCSKQEMFQTSRPFCFQLQLGRSSMTSQVTLSLPLLLLLLHSMVADSGNALMETTKGDPKKLFGNWRIFETWSILCKIKFPKVATFVPINYVCLMGLTFGLLVEWMPHKQVIKGSMSEVSFLFFVRAIRHNNSGVSKIRKCF